MEKVNDPSQYVGTHQDYPRIGFLDSAFPYFTEMGFYDQQAPRDYVGVCKSPGFFAAFSYAGSILENIVSSASSDIPKTTSELPTVT